MWARVPYATWPGGMGCPTTAWLTGPRPRAKCRGDACMPTAYSVAVFAGSSSLPVVPGSIRRLA
eukprot:3129427-Karenia_brevis.AAC.1